MAHRGLPHRRTLLLGALMVSCAGCADSLGPAGPEGRLLAAGSLALEWAADGREIYYYSSGYSNTYPVVVPNKILAVNLSTGVSRVVVSTCAFGVADPALRGFPPRETIAGLAYIRSCTGDPSLHLVLGGKDSVLAPHASWVTRTDDRTRLIYSVPSVGAAQDSIGVIDLVRSTRYTIATAPFGPTIPGVVSPGGTAMLVERNAGSGRFAILNLVDGAVRILDDSVLPYSTVPLGWNSSGLWFIGDLRTLVIYDPTAGAVRRFGAGEPLGSSRVLTGGTASSASRAAAVWQQTCNVGIADAGCSQAEYNMWLWNPLEGVDRLLVRLYTSPADDFPRSLFGAFSPGGGQFAYTLGNELRLLALP